LDGRERKVPSGVKTPVPWGCLIAGDKSPAYRSRPARFPASRRVGVRGFPGLQKRDLGHPVSVDFQRWERVSTRAAHTPCAVIL
jgi:hypothetical protein